MSSHLEPGKARRQAPDDISMEPTAEMAGCDSEMNDVACFLRNMATPNNQLVAGRSPTPSKIEMRRDVFSRMKNAIDFQKKKSFAFIP
ncbi:hypothetical protein DAPPUDRAFT_235905 [Daphnia pulex]|uniref:Uncharacterized protein n=1 Tax=Daphnia pulex TaxID=6669 RepID=E9FZD0_DAPPU|nr:hypothetical protein DAPPUDRAFT_235905 [Daphnia pulex]|eukprot:EFX87031.1 hypothetical protein DAPPUDRAFT_235905 [Daphnia pulex]